MVPEDLQPGVAVGEYQIERVIGEGSFGKVYAAVHPMIGKHAAIKVLGFEHSANPQFVSRFLEEARAVNKIRHRNIVDIFSFGQLDDGRNYLVMELLEGKPMSAWLAERGPIPVAEALPILRKVARALEAAHKQQIAHRDLKPDNIFLTFDEDGVVFPVLLDFGIAKLMGDGPMGHKTQTGTPMGTPLYMAPEQCKGSAMDHRTDIYSFGIVAFEMLTGRRPFDSDNVMEILMAHLSQAPPKMSTVLSSLPAALDPPIERMLEKKPDARPPSITIAIEALTAAARSVGIAVPSSRVVATRGQPYGTTAPMSGNPAAQSISDTVPETPHVDPRPVAVRNLSPTTQQSPVYTAPQPFPVPAHTNVDSSLQPGTASIARTPARGGGAGKVLLAGIVVAALVGGGVFMATRDEADDTTEPDEDDGRRRRDTSDDDGGGDGQATPPGPTKDGVTFGDQPLGVGATAATRESSRLTFTVVAGSKKTNVLRSLDQHSTFEVLATDDAGVSKARITFSKSEWNESIDHGASQKSHEPVHGQTYEVAREGGSTTVNKRGGTLAVDERKSVERHVAGLLGRNLLASTLDGKTLAIGQRIELPFVTTMHLLREYDKSRFRALTGSIALQKIDDAGNAVFNAAISYEYDNDFATLLSSDLTGTLSVEVGSGRVVAVELYGPLNLSNATQTFEPGTFNYNYTTSY